MPKIEPDTPEWDAKIKRIAVRQIGSWEAIRPKWDAIKQAAESYAHMQCDRDFWKEMFMEEWRKNK